MENKWLWLLILLSLCVPAKAVARPKKHKSHKVWFSAHRDSVLLENMAAGALHRYLTQAEAEERNAGTELTFWHAGGSSGLMFQCLSYTNNEPGTSAPVFGLYKAL